MKLDDVETNRDLLLITLGALMQREEAGVLATSEDLMKLAELTEKLKHIDPVKENP